MTTYNWADLYDQAVTNFHGERPGPQIEQRILDTFEQNPQAVKAAIEQVGKQYAKRKITSGWAVLDKHIATHTGPTADRTVSDKSQRAKRITQAETWIQNAGIHYDTASEVEDELFGDRGMLKDWPDLRDRILQLWREARPIGQQLEADLEARSEHWKATTGVLLAVRRREHAKQRAAEYTTNADLITNTFPDVDLPAELQPQETT